MKNQCHTVNNKLHMEWRDYKEFVSAKIASSKGHDPDAISVHNTSVWHYTWFRLTHHSTMINTDSNLSHLWHTCQWNCPMHTYMCQPNIQKPCTGMTLWMCHVFAVHTYTIKQQMIAADVAVCFYIAPDRPNGVTFIALGQCPCMTWWSWFQR